MKWASFLLSLSALGSAAAAQPSCFSGPTRDPNNSWQTYWFENRCGGAVRVYYSLDDGKGVRRSQVFVAPCSRTNLQGFQSWRYTFQRVEWDNNAAQKTCVRMR